MIHNRKVHYHHAYGEEQPYNFSPREMNIFGIDDAALAIGGSALLNYIGGREVRDKAQGRFNSLNDLIQQERQRILTDNARRANLFNPIEDIVAGDTLNLLSGGRSPQTSALIANQLQQSNTVFDTQLKRTRQRLAGQGRALDGQSSDIIRKFGTARAGANVGIRNSVFNDAFDRALSLSGRGRSASLSPAIAGLSGANQGLATADANFLDNNQFTLGLGLKALLAGGGGDTDFGFTDPGFALA